LFFKTLINIQDGLKADLQDRFKQYSQGNQKLIQDGLNTSRFRDGVSIEQALDLLNIYLEGLSAGHVDQLSKMDVSETIPSVEKMLEENKKN
jgi:hypothetical protein